MLKLEKLTKTYESGSKRLSVLRQIDLELSKGELMAIVGRSGSGKTTLLNCIAGLDTVDSGKILLEGRDLTELSASEWDLVRQKEIGFVFQFNQLLPEFSALENVMLPGLLRGRKEAELKEQARDLLCRMSMEERLGHRPAQLSGGEQQRTAIARALINRPRLLLADEPTGSLDLESGQKVFGLLQQMQKELEISCLIVTHSPALADLCARIHRLDQPENHLGHEPSPAGV